MRALLFFLLSSLPLLAEFSEPSKVVRLSYGQREAVVEFEADAPIRKAKPLCECTKLQYRGNKITARVDTSGFAKNVEKQIEATTADGTTTRLTMVFEVPQALQLSTRSLIWRRGEAAPKRVEISIPKGSPVRGLREASLVGDAFDYTPHTQQEGRRYEIVVKPLRADKKILNRLVVKTDSPDPRYAQYIIYLSVQP